MPSDDFVELRERVTRLEERLEPIRLLVYGLVGTVGLAVVASVVALVLK